MLSKYGWALLIFLVAFAFESGCGARARQHPHGMATDVGPGPLAPLQEDADDFFAEHEVTIQWGDKSRTFRAVLQHRQHTMELIILGPMEQPIVRIYQQNDDVGVERLVQGPLPFEPEYILADVQKAFFKWPNETFDKDGIAHGQYQTLAWTEAQEDTNVQWREFVREDLPQKLPLRVEYTYDQDDAMPSRVQLENTWFGYTLKIRTLRWSLLE